MPCLDIITIIHRKYTHIHKNAWTTLVTARYSLGGKIQRPKTEKELIPAMEAFIYQWRTSK